MSRFCLISSVCYHSISIPIPIPRHAITRIHSNNGKKSICKHRTFHVLLCKWRNLDVYVCIPFVRKCVLFDAATRRVAHVLFKIEVE